MPAGFAITRDSLLEHARKLPAAPQVMSGLCELLQDINTDLDEIAGEIRMDPALAARVIRIANSIAFGIGARVGSVDEAVNRVGFAEVLRLVGAAAVAGLVDQSLACYRLEAVRLRESLLLHALASEALADAAGLDSRLAYSGGLLRALGMMVLERAARDRLPTTDRYDPDQFDSYSQWEGLRFGLAATEVATIILDEWRFPAELVAAVQDHLAPLEAGRVDQLACVLNLAGRVVAETGLALPGEAVWWTPAAEKLAGAGLDESQYEYAATRARTCFHRQRGTVA